MPQHALILMVFGIFFAVVALPTQSPLGVQAMKEGVVPVDDTWRDQNYAKQSCVTFACVTCQQRKLNCDLMSLADVIHLHEQPLRRWLQGRFPASHATKMGVAELHIKHRKNAPPFQVQYVLTASVGITPRTASVAQ